jgi:hypothetical protein
MKMSESTPARNVLVRRLSGGVLWLGLALCAYATWRMFPQIEQAKGRLGIWHAATLFTCLLAAWFLTVSAWRLIVLAFTSISIPWSNAFRQSGLLLVGKYIPGGVFGFMARMSEGDATVSTKRHFVAGLYEQATSLLITTATGAVFYLSARMQEPWLLAATLIIPFAVAAAAPALGFVLSRLRKNIGPEIGEVEIRAPSRVLLPALFLQHLVVMSWMGIVVIMATGLYGLGLLPAIGVAGAFSLGISAGLLVIIVPGGMGIREGAFAGLAVAFLPWQAALACAAMLRMLAMLLDVGAGCVAVVIGACRYSNNRAGMQ